MIALMVGEGEDWKDVAIPGAAPAAASASDAEQAIAPSGGSVQGQEIKMPSLSPTMSEGTIVKWLKKEGDAVAPGDVLCEIQTDKAVMSFETEEEGILAKILVPADSLVQVGKLIALMVAEGEDWKDVAIPGSGPVQSAPAPAAKPVPAPSTTSPAPAAPAHHPPKPHEYGPAVHRLLEQYQISSKDVTPSGRNSKLLKLDVLKFIDQNKLQPLPPRPVPLPVVSKPAAAVSTSSLPPPPPSKPRSGYTDIEVSSMRRTIAKRLTESKTQIPHMYSSVESSMDKTMALRAQLKSAGVNVSVNDFVIKAVALALRQCPLVNCLYTKDEVVSHPTIDISVAVATDNGLITPIVKNADDKAVDAISAEVRELANKARQNKLQLHEFQGGSFTISNLGMFGISEFSAIINPPQCAILAVGGGQPFIDIHGNPVSRMTAQLSYDARAISETAAAEFLQVFKLYLENPAALVLSSPATHIKTQAYAN
uniref:Dihydrolipoamide acetyltransferase component of pyruvate dehydrogenase complex n=1 Tax=Cacopsylla melanoneura TaxID=428564 RepID=A0A8D8TP10_9HEMI